MNSVIAYLKRNFTNSFTDIKHMISIIEEEPIEDEYKSMILDHLDNAKSHLTKAALLMNVEYDDEILNTKKWNVELQE